MRELHEQKILPTLISYTVPYRNMSVDTDGWDWIKIALRSFHDHFDGQKVLVVDNDKDGEAYKPKRDWLHSYPGGIVVRNPLTRDPGFWQNHDPAWSNHHGLGIDVAVAYCQRHGFDYMLYFEPDCLIEGGEWVEAMWRCMEGGAWMSGFSHCNHSTRIIHVCPSMWKVNEPPCTVSFMRQPIEADKRHPGFDAMTDLRGAAKSWDKWDTGQRNWWIAALEGKACRARPRWTDFSHYWSGSGHTQRRRVREHHDYQKLKRYLD